MSWLDTQYVLERARRLEDLFSSRMDFLLHLVEKHIMAALDDLKREVAETKTISASAIALIEGLKAKLDEAIATGDPAALQALSDELDTQGNALAAAVTANTPASPTPVPNP